ncbi:DNA adenine methylase [Kushneria sp. Sum13]|uniref:DNA adenine methylase n=1 Tax=Kushneria sp. Sum13 TaxID=3459196 RepID=UPI004045E71E
MWMPCSPLRYPGGKSCLKPLLFKILKGNSLYRCHYAEPYAGGGGLALSLLYSGDVSDIHLNDIDPAIWSFWYSVLNKNQEFIELVENAKLDIDEWQRQRYIYNNESVENPLALGFSAFYLNRTNRSGVIQGAGVIGGVSQAGNYKMDCRFNKFNLVERIKRVERYKSRIHLYRLDAIEFMLSKGFSERTFFCIDPPYVKKGPELYTNSYSLNDHVSVANTVKRLKQPWIVTYDNSEVVKNAYSENPQYSIDVRYSLNEKKMGNEILISSDNLQLPAELKSKRIDFSAQSLA